MSSRTQESVVVAKNSMIKLLEFLITFCVPLFERYQFRISGSGMGNHQASGAWLLLATKDVEMQLSLERDEFSLFIRSLHDSQKRNWYSIELISGLLGRQVATGIMNQENCIFFSESIDEIMQRFNEDCVAKTITELNKLKAERASRM